MNHTSVKLATLASCVAACCVVQAAETRAAPTSMTVAAAQVSATSMQCAADPKLSSLQRRLLAHYDEGVPRMVSYVWITRGIYQLDARETAMWAASYRAQHPRC
jgi:hypothetical protein